MAPDGETGHLLMILQAFMDESEGQDGTFVLAGHVASAEVWAKFSAEWEHMLPAGTLAPNGKFHFKMSEMAANPERMARVPGFFRIIEEHVLFSLSCCFNLNDLKQAMDRLWIPDCSIDWGFIGNRYLFAFRVLMDMFHANKHELVDIVSLDQPIDFIFDERIEKKTIYAIWDNYVAERPPETRNLYGEQPLFRNDQKFLPLQAADFWAWWVREWHGDPEKIEKGDFGSFIQKRTIFPKVSIAFDESQLVRALMALAGGLIEPERFIYDVRYPRDPAFSRDSLPAHRTNSLLASLMKGSS